MGVVPRSSQYVRNHPTATSCTIQGKLPFSVQPQWYIDGLFSCLLTTKKKLQLSR